MLWLLLRIRKERMMIIQRLLEMKMLRRLKKMRIKMLKPPARMTLKEKLKRQLQTN